MKRSDDRILTTHAGSLPRSPALLEMLVRLSKREPVDAAALAREVEASTRHVIVRQLAAGIDVGNDGEQPRESFVTYVQHRMSGFSGASERPIMRDIVQFQSFLALKLPDFSRTMVSLLNAPRATGPVRYLDRSAVDAECTALARLFADRPLADFLRWVDLVVGAINHAIAGIPPDRVRLHVCWGNYEAPHTLDVPLEEILPRLYAARVGALVVSMANPRHAHEHRCFARHPLPNGMLLVAGVVDTTTNYVEHPEVVADRIELAARAVGDPRRVLAGTDCGFATAAGLGEVAEEVVWEKLAALRTGADLATRRLLG